MDDKQIGNLQFWLLRTASGKQGFTRAVLNDLTKGLLSLAGVKVQ